MKEQRFNCVAYYQKDLNELRSFDFVIHTTATNKKDLLDIAIRNWEVYWCEHFGVWGNEWLIMDVWESYCGGQYKELKARRYSRRCPAQFRCIAEDQTLIV